MRCRREPADEAPRNHRPDDGFPRPPDRHLLASRRTRTPGAGRWASSPTASTSAHRPLQAGARARPRSDLPDEVDDVARHRIRLLELQEVPRALDDEDVSAGWQNSLHPSNVIRCHATVVVTMQ